jgi:hypothetical protein
MPEDKAIAFFRAISVGTPVTVFGTAPLVRQYQASNRDYYRPRRAYSYPYPAPFGFPPGQPYYYYPPRREFPFEW